MFHPISLSIALRYTQAQRKKYFGSFMSFMSLVSILGMALGVAVLITVLSVMNGFDEVIHEKIFNMAPQILVTDTQGNIENWEKLSDEIRVLEGVETTSPLLNGQGMLSYKGGVTPIMVSGILPSYEKNISKVQEKITEGSMDALTPGGYGIILNSSIAGNLGLSVGDKLTLLIPEATISPAGILPRYKRFTVVGIFNAGSGFGFTKSLAFVHLQDAQRLYQMTDLISHLRVSVPHLYDAPRVAYNIAKHFDYQYQVNDWTHQYGDFLSTVRLEKDMMFYILTLIVVVAVFNLVSSLVMVVNDKQADIATLKTMGMPTGAVLRVFIFQGLVIGLIGTIIGFFGGLLLTYNAQTLIDLMQNIFQRQIFPVGVYVVDYLPVKVLTSDIAIIVITAIGLSLVATLYPAWRASRVQPAAALRYE